MGYTIDDLKNKVLEMYPCDKIIPDPITAWRIAGLPNLYPDVYASLKV